MLLLAKPLASLCPQIPPWSLIEAYPMPGLEQADPGEWEKEQQVWGERSEP